MIFTVYNGVNYCLYSMYMVYMLSYLGSSLEIIYNYKYTVQSVFFNIPEWRSAMNQAGWTGGPSLSLINLSLSTRTTKFEKYGIAVIDGS